MTKKQSTKRTPMPDKDVVDKLYMCSTDFDYELGNAAGGTKLYASIEDLKENSPCTACAKEHSPCGIYEVEVHLVEIIQESSF